VKVDEGHLEKVVLMRLKIRLCFLEKSKHVRNKLYFGKSFIIYFITIKTCFKYENKMMMAVSIYLCKHVMPLTYPRTQRSSTGVHGAL